MLAARGAESLRRDRLLAAIALFAGLGLLIALPFALRAGTAFFLPVTAALVIAIALVPTLEWLERRGVPSSVAAFFCIAAFLAIANAAVAAIIVPASGWFALLPQRVVRIRHNLRPLIELYGSLDRFVSDTSATFMRVSPHAHTVTVAAPNSLLDVVASSAPVAILQMFFALLVVYFFLSGWTRMRRNTITSRGSFTSALTTARVIQEMVDSTSAYLSTITIINIALGLMVAFALWLIGLPDPLMWGGIVALFNYMPYLGPIMAALLLALGGLMVFRDAWYATFPVAVFVGCHLIESNIITPSLVGRRLTINPLLILVSLSFWGWVWGATGALLAVPLLIIMKTVLDAAGKPDIAGFLFEDGTLTGPLPEPPSPPFESG
ncbi:AI-2E family transporter [Sphingomonas nostoxanthinifaciens]|uniref:AI-2E family transporter n=1 Tax=Sphingomonas nostoxanthinifaciens TaxID=2872652 RepID=UPI001CC212C4|nr:AI-2E family transporter [Sphingomonas nostoxanthinifaciens]UAK26725.1 AI-2E family transporter [Sphingomonas nostoxanthinifaciens]